MQNEMCMDLIHLHQEFKRIKNRPEYQGRVNCWPRPWTVVPYENVWDRTVDESDDLKCPCTFYSHMLHHLG